MVPDPRTERAGICGHRRTTGNTEWVCIAEPHDEDDVVRPFGLYGNYPKSEQHAFVPRYPKGSKK